MSVDLKDKYRKETNKDVYSEYNVYGGVVIGISDQYVKWLEKQVENNDLLHSVVGSYDHCNIVDVVTNKTILSTPANRFEVKFMNVDKEVGKIQI